MDAHQVLDVIACVGHLAFAAFALSRFQKSPLAFPLALLFLDAFAWNFADLAYELSGAIEWHLIDRFFSSFMPALMLHLIVVFVGKTRALRWTVRAAYVASLALSAMLLKPWWMFLGIVSLLIMCLCITLVVKHRVTSNDPEERSRADLMLLAVALGTALGTTDLWHNEVGFFVPRLSNLGILIGLAMMAVAALRLRLLGREVRPALALYALLGGALWVTAYLAAVRWFEPHQGVYVLSVATALAFGIAVVREARRAQSVARERVQRLAVLGRFSDQLAHDLRNPLAALKGALQFLAVEREQG
ncbi:MAG TPA: hypothetical protein VGJ84_07290, partial [Polyangiaceae bacterium]